MPHGNGASPDSIYLSRSLAVYVMANRKEQFLESNLGIARLDERLRMQSKYATCWVAGIHSSEYSNRRIVKIAQNFHHRASWDFKGDVNCPGRIRSCLTFLNRGPAA